jgi:hypothetical protein
MLYELEIFDAKDKLPKENRWIVMFDNDNYYLPEWHKGYYLDGKWYSERAERFDEGIYTPTELYNVTHWAELPDISLTPDVLKTNIHKRKRNCRRNKNLI